MLADKVVMCKTKVTIIAIDVGLAKSMHPLLTTIGIQLQFIAKLAKSIIELFIITHYKPAQKACMNDQLFYGLDNGLIA